MKLLIIWAALCTALTLPAMHVSCEDEAQQPAPPKSIEMKNFAAKSSADKSYQRPCDKDNTGQEQEFNVICIGNLNRNNRPTWYSHIYTLASVDKSTTEKQNEKIQ